ncbi:MAG: hypothetical protein LBD75_00465 [Candidatus Peribacteria bacterium]|jgi:hypothetical protein|nr:hypothetical protein [Candidatus Peribacteria bacterium]
MRCRRKLTLTFLIGIATLSELSFAQMSGESFFVEVNPSTFQLNQPVDVTITAMKNGAPHTTYTGDVRIGIDNLRPSEYSVPSMARYNFVAEDLGTKTFSKGLEIKKAGSYTLTVHNYENTLKGSAQITVSDPSQTVAVKKITILSPLPHATETNPDVLLLAQIPELPNSIAQIYLNGTPVEQTTVDYAGTINRSLIGLKEGENTLYLTILSINNEEVGRSEEISFTYEPPSNQLLSGVTLTPQTGLRVGDKATFDVQTTEIVTSANLILSYGMRLPLDKLADGHFSRSTVMLATGTISGDIELVAGGQAKTYTGVISFFVDETPLISNVTFKLNPQNIRNLHMSRQVTGIPVTNFEVYYGTAKEQLEKTVETTGTEIVFKNIDTTKEYFFKIIPLLGTGTIKEHGAATEIYTYTPSVSQTQLPDPPTIISGNNEPTVIVDVGENTIPLCTIKGIRVVTQKIGNNYYLVWDQVANAISYTVYMSEINDSSQKIKLLETKETRYEYPFDHSVEQNQYAYFRVEATCDDGQVLELTSAKKVQVGPTEDILMLICVSLLIYAGIRLYRYAE